MPLPPCLAPDPLSLLFPAPSGSCPIKYSASILWADGLWMDSKLQVTQTSHRGRQPVSNRKQRPAVEQRRRKYDLGTRSRNTARVRRRQQHHAK